MKFIMYKVNGDKRNRKHGFNAERIITFSFILVFSLMVLVQIILATPLARNYLVKDIEFEGNPVSTQEYLYKEGEITLELINNDSDQDLLVLVNGDVEADFLNKTVKLIVKEGDVIEIDGTGTERESEIAVSSCSDNISKVCIGKKANVYSNVKSLIKIKMD